MTNLLQAANQALEALGRVHFAATELDRRNRVRWFDDAVDESKQAITALRQAIAQAEQQKPDYFGLTHDHTWLSIDKKQYDKLKPEGRMTCYTSPLQREWVEPSDEQIAECGDFAGVITLIDLQFARAVLKLAKELNT